ERTRASQRQRQEPETEGLSFEIGSRHHKYNTRQTDISVRFQVSRGKFEGKVVVITGSARGQGKSHALGFAREGAEVVVNDVCRNASSVPYPLATERELDGTVEEIKKMGGRVLGIKADVGIEADAKRLV